MSRPILKVALVGALLMSSHSAAAQPAATLDPSRKWEITDNSFLVEESFNQERGVVQNIFTWTRSRNGEWVASFTQEWPAPGMTHQLSYTVPFARVGAHRGLNDVLLNYRYQLLEEGAGRPAISPRLSVILPTGSEPDGLGDGVVGLQMNVPVSKQFGDIYLHGNAGWTWLPGVEHVPNLGASGIWRVTSMFNLMLEGLVVVSDSATISPGFRRGWNFGERQLVIGAAVPVTRAGGSTSAALLTYFSYELPFR
jgi:hypothetical protein